MVDKFVHSFLHLLKKGYEVSRLIDLPAVFEILYNESYPVRPPLHVLDLECACLKPKTALLVFLQTLIQLALVLINLQVNCTIVARRVRVESQPIGVPFKVIELFPKCLQANF